MASNTYVLLAKATVGAAGASSITLSNIPQTGYTDLLIKASYRDNNADVFANVYVRLNNDSSSIYSIKNLQSNGSSASSHSGSSQNAMYYTDGNGASSTSSTFSNTEFYLPNYASSNYKSISWDNATENNATTAYLDINAYLYSSSNPITRIDFISGGSFAQYSTFYLYGVSNVNTTPTVAPKASGGDIIVNDGTYWYHAFRSTGVFTPQVGLTADALVIAGGGGSARATGGGGAGQVLNYTSQSLTTTGYTVTVGAGGTGINTNTLSTPGGNGTSSQFGALTASSGGNASVSYNSSGNWPYGGTSGNGNAGGANSSSGAGGGGGQGAVGSAANGNTAGGNGGAGISTYSSWGSATSTGQNVSGTYWFAGGGGGGFNNTGGGSGGTGGNGGGGNGGGYDAGGVAATAGTANTGGGAGGGSNNSPYGANGGSGIVIIRYAM